MEPVILALEEKYEHEIVFVIADMDDPEGRRLADSFNIGYIPAFLYFDTSGDLIAHDVGAQTKASLENRILQLLSFEN